MTVIVSFSISGIFAEAYATEGPPFKMDPAITVALAAADAIKNSLLFISFIITLLLKVDTFSKPSKVNQEDIKKMHHLLSKSFA